MPLQMPKRTLVSSNLPALGPDQELVVQGRTCPPSGPVFYL